MKIPAKTKLNLKLIKETLKRQQRSNPTSVTFVHILLPCIESRATCNHLLLHFSLHIIKTKKKANPLSQFISFILYFTKCNKSHVHYFFNTNGRVK